MHFLISPALAGKPILAKHDSGRHRPKGPFVDPDPSFVLCAVGPAHTLLLNKFCAVRPMLLLCTAEFRRQADGLDGGDLAAAWSLLSAFEAPMMVLYNCGADAGASQGHKHMQMFPAPDPGDCVMFPEKLRLDYGAVPRSLLNRIDTDS
jgi:ATP adenylyltransferase